MPTQKSTARQLTAQQLAAESLAVSVHGAAGVLDLVVPTGAAALDVAREYAGQVGLAAVPALHTATGVLLPPDLTLTSAGVEPGDLLVAGDAVAPAAGRSSHGASADREDRRDRPGAGWWAALAAGCALVAGWAAQFSTDEGALAIAGLLLLGALVGVLPVGALAARRVVVAPAFTAGAALALAWDPNPERLPMVVGVAGLAAALAAAAARSLSRIADEALQVWIVAGMLVFVVTCLCAMVGAPPRLDWALILLGSVLAARFVPALTVDVPDQYLLDLERLAVTAWSAREQVGGKRGRSVVRRSAVSAVAVRGTRMIVSSSAAVMVLALTSAPLLLVTATLPVDRIGARCLVGFAGAALLLAARSYRNPIARALLRMAGLGCWVALSAVLLQLSVADLPRAVAITTVVLAGGLVVVAVALGRGWRSAWWSRRAEVAEGLSGALAVASLVVAAGWFRAIWELASLWELGN